MDYKFFEGKTLETGHDGEVLNTYHIISISLVNDNEIKSYRCNGKWGTYICDVSDRVDFDELTLREIFENGKSERNFPVIGNLFWKLRK